MLPPGSDHGDHVMLEKKKVPRWPSTEAVSGLQGIQGL